MVQPYQRIVLGIKNINDRHTNLDSSGILHRVKKNGLSQHNVASVMENGPAGVQGYGQGECDREVAQSSFFVLVGQFCILVRLPLLKSGHRMQFQRNICSQAKMSLETDGLQLRRSDRVGRLAMC